MNILNDIVSDKRKAVEERKSLYPVKLLEQSIYFQTPVVSLRKYLTRTDKIGIIAEFKRRSPGYGMINAYADVEQVSIGYMQAGASALSVLTDTPFFGGKSNDLTIARKFNFCPILMKDFVIDEYQILEAKSIGADAILLIAAILTQAELTVFAKTAHMLGLEVLVEVHSEAEIQLVKDVDADVLGINNRNLDDHTVDIQTSLSLRPMVPPGIVVISESGIRDPETIVQLKASGFDGFLMGEYFMSDAHPHLKCADFIRSVQSAMNQLSAEQAKP
jgi:indole-3-glycerol phosphate synthase